MKGFTMIELMIVIAILAILAAIAIPAITGDHPDNQYHTPTTPTYDSNADVMVQTRDTKVLRFDDNGRICYVVEDKRGDSKSTITCPKTDNQ